MRFPDNTLIGDLNDNFSAKTSGSLVAYGSSSINENETVYDLLPVIVNRPPIIIASITQASTPKIQPYSTADASGKHMYTFPDGTVKIGLGATISFSIKAEQPNVLNVENGVPTMMIPTLGLVYTWRKNGNIISSYKVDSLSTSLIVDSNTVSIKNIQPEHAGSYTCDVSNDIGTISSEAINVEVLNLDFDSYFYKNLIKNPYGLEDTNEWNSLSDDLTTKTFSKAPSEDFIKPNELNKFGYTIDMMHPRPYQIDTGVIKNLDMTKAILSNNASYFTRSRYKLIKDGGNFLVRAYQDIDVTDIEWLIKGGVYGIEGVRAIFSCYIGNGLSSFTPVQELIDPGTRLDPKNYAMDKPRISAKNFLMAGPSTGPQETVYITLEEYDNETRLPSTILNNNNSISRQNERITLLDPWTKRIGNYIGRKYYDTDVYGIGQLSQGDARDSTLFTAQELYPTESLRYTYGQYAEFNKVVLDRLNPKTTKVRVVMNFETSDGRLFDNYLAIRGGNSDEPYEFGTSEQPYNRNSWIRTANYWETSVVNQQTRFDKNKDKNYRDYIPLANDPRGMITALNLSLIPILTQDKNTTRQHTGITLTQNGTPQSKVPTGLSL
jgi:hypothetical protein